MFAFAFSCAMNSTLRGKSGFPPVWSPWECVLMIVVTGLAVTDFTWSRMALPKPAYLASMSTTPLSAMNTVVFPAMPPPCRPPVTM